MDTPTKIAIYTLAAYAIIVTAGLAFLAGAFWQQSQVRQSLLITEAAIK